MLLQQAILYGTSNLNSLYQGSSIESAPPLPVQFNTQSCRLPLFYEGSQWQCEGDNVFLAKRVWGSVETNGTDWLEHVLHRWCCLHQWYDIVWSWASPYYSDIVTLPQTLLVFIELRTPVTQILLFPSTSTVPPSPTASHLRRERAVLTSVKSPSIPKMENSCNIVPPVRLHCLSPPSPCSNNFSMGIIFSPSPHVIFCIQSVDT